MALGIIVTGLNAGVRSLLTTEIQPVKKSNQRGESVSEAVMMKQCPENLKLWINRINIQIRNG